MTQLQRLEAALEIVRRYPLHFGPWWVMYLGVLIEMRKAKQSLEST